VNRASVRPSCSATRCWKPASVASWKWYWVASATFAQLKAGVSSVTTLPRRLAGEGRLGAGVDDDGALGVEALEAVVGDGPHADAVHAVGELGRGAGLGRLASWSDSITEKPASGANWLR
jgi:hypothetical protein